MSLRRTNSSVIVPILGLLWFGFAKFAVAQQDSMPGLFYDLGSNIGGSFTGRNLFLQTGAIASTYLIVESGWDYDVHHYFYENPNVGAAGAPAASVGALVPVLLAGGLWTYGHSAGQSEVVVAGNAVAQAVALAFTYHEMLKAVTGRPAPQGVPESDMERQSRVFRFGFLRGGLFWGWPSGHLITNTAAVSALSAFYPDNTTISVAKYAWIGYMFYGVSSHHGGSMHWFSDAVAGTCMGLAFGQTVGKRYHEGLHPSAPNQTVFDRIHVYPTVIADAPGLAMTMDFSSSR